ncbi:hypothetical protein ACVBEQ_11475 [Nakamurella sp. GG22]
MSLLMTAMQALAEAPPADIDPTTGKGAEFGKAAPVGLLVILLMCVATFFLLRSMNRNMRKVPKSFGPIAEQGAQPLDAESAEAERAGSDVVEDGSEPVGERSPRPPA